MQRFVSVPIAALLLCGCSAPPEAPMSDRHPQPPGWAPARVSLAVGNAYNREVTEIGIGTFFRWTDRSTITGDTVTQAGRFFRFDSGELRAVSEDTVFGLAGDSVTVLYRLRVVPGDTVPFLGSTMRVAAIDTEAVLGDTQMVISVARAPEFPTSMVTARYASRFGVIRLEQAEALLVRTTRLIGARLEGHVYGQMP